MPHDLNASPAHAAPRRGPVAILHLEDSPLDAELARSRLRKSGLDFTIERVDSREEFIQCLEQNRYDLILSDYNLPQFDGYEALSIASERWPHLPFIFVSGVLGEEVAIETLKGGATDYVLKQRIDRLAPAVQRALAETEERSARQLAETRLRESEERYRSLVSVLTDVPWTVNAFGLSDHPEAAWSSYTGQTWPEHRGEGWLNAIHPEDRAALQDTWQSALAKAAGFETERRLWHAKTGGYRYVVIRAIPLTHPNGSVREWVGTCTDVHDRRMAEQERERLLASEKTARAEAEEANRIKDEFLATLSHELRTPLNAILGWSQLVSRGDLDEDEAKEGLDAIARNARVQSQIIDDLLDMSRIISGKVRLDSKPVSPVGIVEEAIESVAPSAKIRGIRLSKAINVDGQRIIGDPARLQQVIWNLLSNSIKFTPSGGEVQIAVAEAGPGIEISIRDSGEGIDPNLLPHVFDRFRQADGSTTRRHGGLGLGLSIVKQLVELHGGTVRAESRGLGLGARFIVSLPTAGSDHHPSSPPMVLGGNDSAARRECEQVSLSGVRVLVVDDEPDALNLVARILRGCDAAVLSTASAAEGLRLVQAERPDVLVSDIGMPGEDGYELIRKIRALSTAEGGDTPAIAFTAFARSEDRQRALRAGFQHHIAKPIEPAELIRTIAAVSGRAPATGAR